MRFSKWHALGNSYLVVDEGMEAELAQRLCDLRYGIGSDGVVEVVSSDGAAAEIAIWNPDGSLAEFSGNGSRIAAAWLGARAGTPQVTIRAGGRSYPAAIHEDGTVAMGVGAVEVGEMEAITVGADAVAQVAEPADPFRVERAIETSPLDEQVAVTERVPLRESHPQPPSPDGPRRS